jgi:hypothetical protein
MKRLAVFISTIAVFLLAFSASSIPAVAATQEPYYFQVWQGGAIYSASFQSSYGASVYVNESRLSLDFSWNTKQPTPAAGQFYDVAMAIQSQNGSVVSNVRLVDQLTAYSNVTPSFGVSPSYTVTLYYGITYYSTALASNAYGVFSTTTNGYSYTFITNTKTSGTVYSTLGGIRTAWNEVASFHLKQFQKPSQIQPFAPIFSVSYKSHYEVSGTLEIPSNVILADFQTYSVWYDYNGKNVSQGFALSGAINHFNLTVWISNSEVTLFAQVYGPGEESQSANSSIFMGNANSSILFTLQPASGSVIQQATNVTLSVYPSSSVLTAYYIDGTSGTKVNSSISTSSHETWTFTWTLNPYTMASGSYNLTFVVDNATESLLVTSAVYSINPSFAVSLNFEMNYNLEANNSYGVYFNISETDNSSLKTAVINTYSLAYSKNNTTVSLNLSSKYMENNLYNLRSYVTFTIYQPEGSYVLGVSTYNTTTGIVFKEPYSYSLPDVPGVSLSNNTTGPPIHQPPWYSQILPWEWAIGAFAIITIAALAAMPKSSKGVKTVARKK